MLAVKHKEMR